LSHYGDFFATQVLGYTVVDSQRPLTVAEVEGQSEFPIIPLD
jgi:hypothetical protein